jgi:8-oxo-dGTP pyrophosphatase MutT (NUDIX family)
MEKSNSPDDAAVREVLEKTGVKVELVGEWREDIEYPVQLHRPAGVPLEIIGSGRQHIDLSLLRQTARSDRDFRELQQGPSWLVRPRRLESDDHQR